MSTRQALDKLRSDMDSLKEKYDASEKALKDKEEIIKNNNMGTYVYINVKCDRYLGL